MAAKMTGAQLRKSRKKLGYTQSELAKKLLLNSGRAVRAYENGENRMFGPVEAAVKLMLKYEMPEKQ